MFQYFDGTVFNLLVLFIWRGNLMEIIIFTWPSACDRSKFSAISIVIVQRRFCSKCERRLLRDHDFTIPSL